MRAMDSSPGRWELRPNPDLGKGPQSRSRFPTAELRDRAETPSQNAAPNESREFGDIQGGTGGGDTGPTPQTPRLEQSRREGKGL